MATTEQINTIEDFWAKVDKSGGANACWPWIGTINTSRGYGDFHYEGERIYAHRMAFKLTYDYLPKFSKRHCRMPHCCNPTHMTDKGFNEPPVQGPSKVEYLSIIPGPNQIVPATRGKFKSFEAKIVQWASVFPPDSVAREAARLDGKSLYFSGRPCRKGHRGNRHVLSEQCESCANDASKVSYKKHSADPEWRQKQVRRASDWAAKNVDRRKARLRIYNEKNRDQISARRASYYQANKADRDAYIKAYYLAHPERKRAQARNRKARMRNAEGIHTGEEIEALFAKQNGKCAICFKLIAFGKNGARNKFDPDHIIAVSKGGTNYIWNIQLTCLLCNGKKNNKDPFIFARQMGRLL